MPEHIEATTLDQINQFVAKHGAAVIDFHATWCGPCVRIGPKLPGFSEKHGVSYIKVDVDEASEVAGKYGVQAMPTFILVNTSGEVERLVGANDAKVDALFEKGKAFAKK